MRVKDLLTFKVFRRRPHEDAALRLYSAVVTQARHPGFYSDLAVADSVDGRFEMIALHAFLVMRRLREAGAAARDLSQAVFDIMFDDMDQNLRELGTGDLGVGKRVKRMAQAFYGRIAAYDAGLAQPDDVTLIAALRRNVYRHAPVDDTVVAMMAAYMRREIAALERQPYEDLRAGCVAFGSIELQR